MVGGRLPQQFTELKYSNYVELLYRFEFPERPGALINFLKNMKSNWTISIFHYRNHGADVGKIVIGVLIDNSEIEDWNNFIEILDINIGMRLKIKHISCFLVHQIKYKVN